MNRTLALPLAACVAALLLTGCENAEQPINPNGPTVTDAQLYSMLTSTTTWTYYRKSTTPLPRGNGSGHPHSHLLTKYNTRAATQLDAGGKVLVDPVFPDSSLIVKELIDNGTVEGYAVMFKMRTAKNAGPNGWLWAEYDTEGTAVVPVSGGAGACGGCHSSGIDYTRMNSSHP